MVILVVSMHSADTYSPLGSWYYTDRTPLDSATLLFFAAWQMYLQSFFMGLLFFVAGYFVPSSFDRKGPVQFVKDRAFRLGLPVLLYMFVLGPVVEYFLAHSWRSTRPTTFPIEWIKHIRNGEFLQENGPLWFCLALLIFSIVYTIWPFRVPRRYEPPTTAMLIGLAAAIAGFTFLVRLRFRSSFLNMHLGDFPQYILLFASGIIAARNDWLPKLSLRQAGLWIGVVIPAGFAAWFAILKASGAFAGHATGLSGGWYWQSAAIDAWEAFTCVALSIGLLVLFRERFNRDGKLARFLSANAFSVYVFHPIFVIAIARAMHPLVWHPLMKFAALTIAAAALSFVASELVFRRIPIARRIL